jgi:hypothetical protein
LHIILIVIINHLLSFTSLTDLTFLSFYYCSNGVNGMNAMMKLSFAKSERNLVDLYLMLCEETDVSRASALETKIIEILSTSSSESEFEKD